MTTHLTTCQRPGHRQPDRPQAKVLYAPPYDNYYSNITLVRPAITIAEHTVLIFIYYLAQCILHLSKIKHLGPKYCGRYLICQQTWQSLIIIQGLEHVEVHVWLSSSFYPGCHMRTIMQHLGLFMVIMVMAGVMAGSYLATNVWQARCSATCSQISIYYVYLCIHHVIV